MKKRIGDILLEKKVINQDQVDEILQYSKRTGLRFGDAALEMGLLDRDKMVQVFGPNFQIDYFHVDPQYYPQSTADVLTLDEMIRFGALPLGMKKAYGILTSRRLLNIGLLDPSNRKNIREIETLAVNRMAERKVKGLNVFLILADQYLKVLESVYEVSDRSLLQKSPEQIDETLHMYINPPT